MEVWGIELKPGRPHCFRFKSDEHRKLRVTKATLGEGLGKEKSVIRYTLGDNKSVPYLFAFLSNENESCSLSLVFECDDGSVEFSVSGDRCVHLTGYFQTEKGKDISRSRSSLFPPRGSRIGGLTLPSIEERYRLWRTLSRQEFRQAMRNYVGMQDSNRQTSNQTRIKDTSSI